MTDLSKLVKPLQFADETGDGVLTSRETGDLYRIFPQAGGAFFAPKLAWGEACSWDVQILIDRLNADHAARVIAAMDGELLGEVLAKARMVILCNDACAPGFGDAMDELRAILARLGVTL